MYRLTCTCTCSLLLFLNYTLYTLYVHLITCNDDDVVELISNTCLPPLQFMSRMVRAYMHEEELRSRHQATLLRLREDALQEKTKAQLEWLKIKKAALQKKGDDDKMPPLARKERGLLKEFKQQQVSKEARRIVPT